ncbi:MAG: tetratricopeptide repeat protein [Acidobacteria bacterium]|nr:tetratricopeptide repeat protein [Acidobacteriota bacterium]
MPAAPSSQTYSREQVRRLLSASEGDLRKWEKHGLIEALESYSFRDLITLRALVKLREQKVRMDRVRRILDAVEEKLGQMSHPLAEIKVFIDGKRIGVVAGGRKMEPISGQLLLDFDRAEIDQLRAFPKNDGKAEQRQAHQKRLEAEQWFQKGIDLEQSGAPVEQVVEIYEKAIAMDSRASGAMVNLGTIYFNALKWKHAEKYYRMALEADPEYPLAHFNLANLFDEMGDKPRALFHYQAALSLNPAYGDAHYNLALLHQTSGQSMKAIQHWKQYLKLDPAGAWADIARRELAKIRDSAVIPGQRAGKEDARPAKEPGAGIVS